MRTQIFETVTRRAAVRLSRRGSLLTLGGATLAATLASPEPGAAKKKGKDCKKKEKKRCNNDIAACNATVEANCLDPEGCPEALLCCEGCSASSFVTCLIASIEG